MNAKSHLIGALVVALAFTTGSWLRKPSHREAPRHLSSSALASGDSSNLDDAWNPADENGAPKKLTPEEARDRVYEILRLGNSYDRCRSMCALIPSITAENWRGVIEAFREQSRKEGRILFDDIDYHLVLERIGAVAGADAMSLYTDFSSNNRQVGFHILTGWGERDPQAASAWLQQLPFPGSRNLLMSYLVVGMARNDPATALEFALLAKGYQKTGDLSCIIDEATQSGGFRAAEDLVGEIEWRKDISEEAKQRFFATLAQRKGALNAANGRRVDTLAWMDQYAGQTIMGAQAVAVLIAGNAIHEPANTLAWLQQNSGRMTDAQRNEAYPLVAAIWQTQNPEQFSGWLAAHADDPQHDAMATAAAELAKDPKSQEQLKEAIRTGFKN